MRRLIDMKVKQQTINRHVTFFIVQVTDGDTNNSKKDNLETIINGNIYFYKDDLDMFAQTYQIKCGEKKEFSFFNICTRNDILVITITIYISYESIFVVCFTDLFLTRINKRWANYVV